jgi:hypothetical protein
MGWKGFGRRKKRSTGLDPAGHRTFPKLSGIEAGRRIRKVSRISRILFVRQKSSADIVHETLSLGARGYVVKSDAGRGGREPLTDSR